MKSITLLVPNIREIPEEIISFTPEENYYMLKIGCDCLLEGRKVVAGFTQKDIHQKIRDEFRDDIQKLELDLLVQKELNSKIDTSVRLFYETQLEQLNKQLEMLRTQIKGYELGNKDIVKIEVDKIRTKYDLLLEEKDKQNKLNREVFDKAEKILNKSVSKTSKLIGDEGENIFSTLCETFRDFGGYKIIKKADQGHKGDFHLFFNEFNVLVDVKKYKNIVNKKEIDKIESDVTLNDDMRFAWLISLDSNISNVHNTSNSNNRFSINYKWFTTDIGTKCIILISNLLSNTNPEDVLRNIWNITYELSKLLVTKDNKHEQVDENLLIQLKDRNLQTIQNIKKLQKRTTELKRNVSLSVQIIKDMETELIVMLSSISNEIIMNETNKSKVIINWWNDNIELDENNTNKLLSTDLWILFKKHNKEYVQETNLLVDQFKKELKDIVSYDKWVEKSKNGLVEISGFKIKEMEPVVIVTNNIIKKVKKNKSELLDDDELNNEIISEYVCTNKDILELSKQYNTEVYKIVSLLVSKKIIVKRTDSRGYDLYKETDEYKLKCKT